MRGAFVVVREAPALDSAYRLTATGPIQNSQGRQSPKQGTSPGGFVFTQRGDLGMDRRDRHRGHGGWRHLNLGSKLATARVTARTQLTMACGDREQQKAEERRGVCDEYLTAVDSFWDQESELVERMEINEPEPEREAAHTAYVAGWENLQRTCAPVIIAGPSELADRAESLKSLLGAAGYDATSGTTRIRTGAHADRLSKYRTAREAAYNDRAAFISAAQQHAYANPGKPLASR